VQAEFSFRHRVSVARNFRAVLPLRFLRRKTALPTLGKIPRPRLHPDQNKRNGRTRSGRAQPPGGPRFPPTFAPAQGPAVPAGRWQAEPFSSPWGAVPGARCFQLISRRDTETQRFPDKMHKMDRIFGGCGFQPRAREGRDVPRKKVSREVREGRKGLETTKEELKSTETKLKSSDVEKV